MTHLSSITQKGQITIPVDMRNALMLHQGDLVKFSMQKDKIIIQKHSKPVEALFGLYRVKHHVSDQDIEKAIVKGAQRGHRS